MQNVWTINYPDAERTPLDQGLHPALESPVELLYGLKNQSSPSSLRIRLRAGKHRHFSCFTSVVSLVYFRVVFGCRETDIKDFFEV